LGAASSFGAPLKQKRKPSSSLFVGFRQRGRGMKGREWFLLGDGKILSHLARGNQKISAQKGQKSQGSGARNNNKIKII